jgi:hypothetical protein
MVAVPRSHLLHKQFPASIDSRSPQSTPAFAERRRGPRTQLLAHCLKLRRLARALWSSQVRALATCRRQCERHCDRGMAPDNRKWAVRGRLGAVAIWGHRHGLALRQERLSGSRYGGRWGERGLPLVCLALRPFLGSTTTPTNEGDALGGARRPVSAGSRNGRGEVGWHVLRDGTLMTLRGDTFP